MKTRKSLRILVLTLAVVMVFAVCSTAFASDENVNGVISPGELKAISENGGIISRTVEYDDGLVLEVNITPITMPTTRANWGQTQYGNWYNIGASYSRNGSIVGSFGQNVFIGYNTRYYFGSMGTLISTPGVGWSNYSVYTTPLDGVKYSFTIHAVYQNNSSSITYGGDATFKISSTGYVTY